MFFFSVPKLYVFKLYVLTLAGNVTILMSTKTSLKMAERSEDKSSKRSFASKYVILKFKYLKFLVLAQSFASRF